MFDLRKYEDVKGKTKSGYNRCGKILVCDDLISKPPIDRLLAEKIPESPNAKVISWTLSGFDVNELQEVLRKRIEAERNMDWKSLYRQEPIEHKGKPYRCICYNEYIRFGAVIDLELSVTQTGRVLAKSVYQNKFKKIYEHYGDFLKEWEEVE